MRYRKKLLGICACVLAISLMPMGTFGVYTNIGFIANAATVEEPSISSSGAILIDGYTGEVLYSKNADTKYYPASITKMMTALLVLENCSLDEIVTFSSSATTNLESGAVSLGIVAGDEISVKDCLYGLMLKSANEVANGLAEHVAGSQSAFANMMNEKAKALGATNTNFVNANGLNDASHVTTARDMALIAKACYENATFRQIVGTTTYTFPATKANVTSRVIGMGHKMIYTSDYRYYEGIIGGKTGYTSKAGNTLVTAAERNGVRLITVILKSSSTHYTDTKTLLDYGFEIRTSASSPSTSTTSSTSLTTGSTTGPGTTSTTEASTESSTTSTSLGTLQTTLSPAETMTSTKESVAIAPGGTSLTSGWYEDSTGWYYIKSTGIQASDETLEINSYTYRFNSDGYMVTGWWQNSIGEWYFYRDWGGMKVSAWEKSGSLWYYLDSDGKMLTNTTTPDGYRVDANGVWVE